MDIDQPYGLRHSKSSTTRSFNGCWTCRLRHKKCDEKQPVCDICSALLIACHYDAEKPEWMDGGIRQEEMAEKLKSEVKENAYHRRNIHKSGDRSLPTESATGDWIMLGPKTPRNLAFPMSDIHDDSVEPCPRSSLSLRQRDADCTLTSKDAREHIAFERSDTVLLMFYLENLFPFLFPYYRPPLQQGGRAWILELMISSPVVKQATLCQSSYFFSLAQGMANWETVLTQTRDAFGVLRLALQVISDAGVTEHLHGTVRIMASVMQVQRFEVAVLSFNNCQAHLNAALALFRQLLDSVDVVEPACPSSSFNAVICHLRPAPWNASTQSFQIPSAEQAAFRFSSALLVLDDIIASTVLQEQPRLYEYHRSLLDTINGSEPPINLEDTVGCQNWALLHIGEIAALDAWKQKSKRAGNLDVMDLVRRATVIKEFLQGHLQQLEADPISTPNKGSSLLDVFISNFGQQSVTPASQSSIVTRIWAHAALIYLFVVVSGWQPASVDVRYHVGRIIELLTRQISPPALLRTMVWPFCVAGCLAVPAQEMHLRAMVEVLQPPSVFGTVRKALEIMEYGWRNRDMGDIGSRDLATCFRSQGDLVLLV
jgi:hypothetical protein